MEWVLIGVAVILLMVVIAIYNGLVRQRQNVNQGVADIDAQLRQRHDLIPNLVETVRGYATHERDTLDAVIEARNKAAQGGVNSGDEAQLRVSLDKLLALSEAYPDLKANTNFLNLQDQLADLENKLAAARRFFNNAVQEFNTGIESFPAVLVAGSLGFHKREFFDLGETRPQLEQPPQVKF